MSFRNRPRTSHAVSCAGETAHLAHAAAHVLRALTVKQVDNCGADLMALIHDEIGLGNAAPGAKPSPAAVREMAAALARKRGAATALDRTFEWVGDLFGFDEIERKIMITFARWGKFDAWRELVRRSPHSCSNLTPAALAQLANLPVGVVEEKLMPGAPLVCARLLNDDCDGEYGLGAMFKRLIRVHIETREDLARWLMPRAEVSALDWDDFEHLGPLRDVTERVAQAREPVSIMLFGEPGTGKSEFARALAARVGCGATFAGLADEMGDEPDRNERLGHLMLLRALCRHHRERVIVVDEADDVLLMTDRKRMSKQWLNRLVEDPQVTTIWIVNRHEELDPALLRRMTLVIGFERPGLPVRERIVRRAAARHAIALDTGELREIAGLKTCAAVVASGMRAAQLAQGGGEVAQVAIHSVMRALGQSAAPEIAPAAVYDPHLSRADTDLDLLANRLAAAPGKRWSLLLSGPSGTGKSAYARHLAARMGIEVEERRCSDLMSAFVGETERNIAQAFAKAAERGAMLLIDEADSFLYAREAGQRTWEVSQVNEMLVQMDHLRVPFVATTNLANKLDPATQRRFTLRVGFQAMTGHQARDLFRAHFAQDWPAHYPAHEGQTPGDFAVVAQRAALLGESEPGVLLRWLREEIEARGGAQRGAMGFCVAAG